MKLKIMKKDALLFIKSNITKFIQHIEGGTLTEDIIKEITGYDEVFALTNINVDEVKLIIDDDKGKSKTDVKNIKLLYEKMKNL